MENIITYPRYCKFALVILLHVVLNSLFNCAVFAQLKPVNAGYFVNEYLMNPAMAGREKIVNSTIGVRQQFNSFMGAPQTQFLVADVGFSEKSGVGLKVYNDKAGLLRQTSLSLSYAYHLPVGNEKQLHFGFSNSLNSVHLDQELVTGDQNDPDMSDVNLRKTHIDADLGLAYTSKSISIQAVFTNMAAVLRNTRKNEVNYSLFYTAASYRFTSEIGAFEPKIAFRGIKGFDNILDLGADFKFKSTATNQLHLFGIYHSSNNASFGFGISPNDKFTFNSSYTMGTKALRNYTSGDFEVNVGYRF